MGVLDSIFGSEGDAASSTENAAAGEEVQQSQ